MPRLSSHLPKYRKHATGQAFVYLDGRSHYLGRHGTKASRQAYDRLISEWTANGRRLPAISEEKTTVVEVCAAYLKHARGYYPEVQHRVLKAIKILKDLYGRSPANDFGPLCLKACRQRVISEGGARDYANRIGSQIRLIFKWAAGEETISHEVPAKLAHVGGIAKGRTNARESEPVLPVADGVVDATLPYLPPIVACMVKLQRLTGVRPAEVCVMRPMDVDRSGEVWIYTPGTHKNEWRGKKRQVAIGPKGQEVLRPFLLRDAKSYCFVPSETVEQWQRAKRQSRKSKVQPSQVDRSKAAPKRKLGARYDTASYRRAVHRACVKASVEQWSPNRLRHAMATEVRKQFGLEGAQVALGHSRASTTDIYAEKNLELAAQVAKRLG